MQSIGQKMAVYGRAAREYFSRPADEKFQSVTELVTARKADKDASAERGYNLKDLKLDALEVSQAADGSRETSVVLASSKGHATLTHWAFSQLCTMLKVSADTMRKLSPAIIAQALNYRIEQSEVGSTAVLLAHGADATHPLPYVRSVTSESYGRLWDAPLYDGLQNSLGPAFKLPPIWGGGNGGAYAGDRDSFVMLVDGGSIVNDPSARQDGRMYRGVLVSNSEVGKSSAIIERVLFEYVCGNLNLWGAVIDKRYRRRHVGSNVLRDVIREIGSVAYDWTNRSASEDEKIIRTLMSLELATSREGVVDELRKMGATKEQAESAYDMAERSDRFTSSPRSFWGVAQSLTSMSQAESYAGDRFELDALAAKVLARGNRVAA